MARSLFFISENLEHFFPQNKECLLLHHPMHFINNYIGCGFLKGSIENLRNPFHSEKKHSHISYLFKGK